MQNYLSLPHRHIFTKIINFFVKKNAKQRPQMNSKHIINTLTYALRHNSSVIIQINSNFHSENFIELTGYLLQTNDDRLFIVNDISPFVTEVNPTLIHHVLFT